jgi:hypothetical protein
MPDAGYSILDSGFWMLDTGYWILVGGFSFLWLAAMSSQLPAKEARLVHVPKAAK